MVLDSELIARLREFLKESDLNTTTTAIVRRRLEEDFRIDLSEKKKFIREQVDLYLQSQFENAEEQEQEQEDENNEEDDQTAKIKSEETDGSDSNEEEEESERARNKRASAKKGSKRVNNEVKRRGGGFNKVCSLSPQLQELVGVPALARTEVVKQIWAYIREKNLQDPLNKKNIICDEPLLALFGVRSIDMFQMNKALSKHIWPLDSDEVVSVKSTEREKQRKHVREEDPDEPKRKEKRQKGFLAPLQLSDALVKFLGTGESVLTRADVIKRMWDYIKENNLQDPSDKRKVICDEKLKELFEVETFTGFTVSKLLAAHFLKT
ncbi:SWIB complex BAF60b domain-containing protein, putative isoform 1 [Theobroma cacao]|uniref:SWIB complex BAF60b domain-containing protein, putative isoform 1 n=1 Tax=Theobroma cacao TaxID=3641 RepID=A0A061DGS2_THECC|nr:SWIB complex BAF60b domain-containing protein, putative isoform 1 [Theobroma cacao]